MAVAFRQLWDGLDFSRARGDLVSVPAVVRRLLADCFRDDARSCAGRNRDRALFRPVRCFARRAGPNQILPILLLAAAILVLLSYLCVSG